MCQTWLEKFQKLFRDWQLHSKTCQKCKGAAVLGPTIKAMAGPIATKLGINLK